MTSQMLFCFMILLLNVASTKEQANSIESRRSGTGLQNALQQLQSLSGLGVQDTMQQMLQSLSGYEVQKQLQQMLQSLNRTGIKKKLQQILQSLNGDGVQDTMQQMLQPPNRSGSSGIVKNDQAKFGIKNRFISIFIGVSIFVIIILTVGGVYYR